MFSYQRSRDQLGWHIFEQLETGRWLLVLKKPYDEIFDSLFPHIRSDSLRADWSNTKKGHRKCLFAELKAEHETEIERFFAAYEQLVLISLNKHLRPHFDNELDFCLALDYHATREDDEITKTETGLHVYEAKNFKKHASVFWLKDRLESALEWLPWKAAPGEWTLTFMPYHEDKGFDLPSYLATSLAGSVPHNWPISSSLPLIDVRTSYEKTPIKNSAIEEKIDEIQKLLGATLLTEAIEGRNCCIIDDLYQSGTSVWSYAKWLKSRGAKSVFALVCSKTMRDSDNT